MTKIRRRAFIVGGCVLAVGGFVGLIWPGPTLWYYYGVDYDNITFAGRHQTALFHRHKPPINELYINGHIGSVSPAHDGMSFSADGWRFTIGTDTFATLKEAGWKTVEEFGYQVAMQSGDWGRLNIVFDGDAIQSVSLDAGGVDAVVSISNPSFAPGKSVRLPCTAEELIAAFGPPDEIRTGFLH